MLDRLRLASALLIFSALFVTSTASDDDSWRHRLDLDLRLSTASEAETSRDQQIRQADRSEDLRLAIDYRQLGNWYAEAWTYRHQLDLRYGRERHPEHGIRDRADSRFTLKGSISRALQPHQHGFVSWEVSGPVRANNRDRKLLPSLKGTLRLGLRHHDRARCYQSDWNICQWNYRCVIPEL